MSASVCCGFKPARRKQNHKCTQTCTRGKCRPTVWILRSCRAWWAVGRWHRLHFVWVGGGHFRLQVRSGRDCGRGRCRLIGAHPHVSHAAQPNQCLLTCASLSRGPGTRQVRGLILVCGHKMGWLILCLLFGHILQWNSFRLFMCLLRQLTCGVSLIHIDWRQWSLELKQRTLAMLDFL